MSGYIDLHLHTSCSDGVLSASELLVYVRSAGLAAFSVTDHDTLAVYPQLKELLHEDDPELITGIELSVVVAEDDMHLLAYMFDPGHVEMNQAIEDFQERRNRRAREMVEKLNELGLGVSFAEVAARASREVIGRPHIAEALYHGGYVASYEEAFHRYIGNGRPAYVPKSRMSPGQAIEIIHRAGGLAVMAHPYVNNMQKYIEELLPLGLDGLEAYHYTHTRPQVSQMLHLVDRFGLVATGGSDFHGRDERNAGVGSQRVPASLLVAMRRRVENVRRDL